MVRKRHACQDQEGNAYNCRIVCSQSLANCQDIRGPEIGRGGYFAIEATQINMGLASVLVTVSDTNVFKLSQALDS